MLINSKDLAGRAQDHMPFFLAFYQIPKLHTISWEVISRSKMLSSTERFVFPEAEKVSRHYAGQEKLAEKITTDRGVFEKAFGGKDEFLITTPMPGFGLRIQFEQSLALWTHSLGRILVYDSKRINILWYGFMDYQVRIPSMN